MHRDRNDRRRAPVRWAVWLAAGSVAVLLTVRMLDDDVVEVFDVAIAALRAAEAALDAAVVEIGAAAEAQRGQNAGSARPGAMSAAAQRAESAARAAGRAGTETRAVLTRVRHMRMERSGTFAEAVATVRGLRDATRALMRAVAALRDGAEALRDAGAVRAAHRASARGGRHPRCRPDRAPGDGGGARRRTVRRTARRRFTWGARSQRRGPSHTSGRLRCRPPPATAARRPPPHDPRRGRR